MIYKISLLLGAVAISALCGGANQCYSEARGGQAMHIDVKSTAFQGEAMIPKLYTCDGKDISPPLSWSGVPAEAKSIALIMDDPDAPRGTWVHWVLFNILLILKASQKTYLAHRLYPTVQFTEAMAGAARKLDTEDHARPAALTGTILGFTPWTGNSN